MNARAVEEDDQMKIHIAIVALGGLVAGCTGDDGKDDTAADDTASAASRDGTYSGPFTLDVALVDGAAAAGEQTDAVAT